VPVPDPLPPAVIAIHASLLDADQAQPLAVVTVTFPVPPPAGTLAEVGAIANVQPEPWVIVNVTPPTVIVPERDAPPEEATVYWTVPVPLPAPDTVIQGSGDDADQAHPLPAVTVIDPEPPAAGTVAVVGDSVRVQPRP
jgi:hypothetical protein